MSLSNRILRIESSWAMNLLLCGIILISWIVSVCKGNSFSVQYKYVHKRKNGTNVLNNRYIASYIMT